MASITLRLNEETVNRFRHALIDIDETEIQIVFPAGGDGTDMLAVVLTDIDDDEVQFCGRIGRHLLKLSKEISKERANEGTPSKGKRPS